MAKQQVATQSSTPHHVALANYFDTRASDFESALAPGVKPEQFMRVLKNAIIRDPEIAKADKQSVFLEVQKCAQDGLVLDGREAVLTRFNTRQQDGSYKVQVAYIPMVAGIMKRVRNSGDVASWTVNVVYEKEYENGMLPDHERDASPGYFRYYAGDDPRIEHRPILLGDRGPLVAVYSSVRLRDGTHHHEVMTKSQLDKIKSRTKSKKKVKDNGRDVWKITGPWSTDEEEMQKKTVIRRHSKRLPMSSEALDVVGRVDQLYDFKRSADEVYNMPDDPEPRSVANKRNRSVSEKLNSGETVDEETGEILDGEVIEPGGKEDNTDNEDQTGSNGNVDPDDEF